MIERDPGASGQQPEKRGLRAADIHRQTIKQGYVEIPAGTEVTFSFYTKFEDGHTGSLQLTGELPHGTEGILDEDSTPEVSDAGRIIEVFLPDSEERRKLVTRRQDYIEEVTALDMLNDLIGGGLEEGVHVTEDENQNLGRKIGRLDHHLGKKLLRPFRDKVHEQGADVGKVIGMRMYIPLADEVDTTKLTDGNESS
jgi:hypothetical protein